MPIIINQLLTCTNSNSN